MEKRSTILRRLPKRSSLLLYVLVAMVGACALVTLYFEREESMLPNLHSTGKIEELPTTLKLVPTGWSWKSKDTSTQKLGDSSTNHSSSTTTQKPRPQRHSKTFHDNTKYIYLNTTSKIRTTASPVIKPVTRQTTVVTCNSEDSKHTKLILLWTSFFGIWGYMPQERFDKCPSGCRNCRVTTDRTRLAESDAVVFHARDMSLFDLPTLRLPHQRWVFYCLESPPYSDFPGLQHMRDMFNWTMTYRADSDVISQYGSVKRIRPPIPLDLQSLKSTFHNKSKSVVWLSSHCPTHGGRDAYVRELSRHIDVDTFGTCGTQICPQGQTDKCLEDFSQKYKFFLAFENTICKDYITEKFFRTLKFDIIPVVFGGASYERFAPPGSFIDALSFKSPKHLAFFLAGVARDFKMYSSYFRWRRDFDVRLNNAKECGMCSLLHRGDLKRSSYKDLTRWWVEESRCRTWEA